MKSFKRGSDVKTYRLINVCASNNDTPCDLDKKRSVLEARCWISKKKRDSPVYKASHVSRTLLAPFTNFSIKLLVVLVLLFHPPLSCFLLLMSRVIHLIGQLAGRKCHECGQPLPESFEPPADEPWTTGIFGCAEDKDSCWRGLFCPCVLFGHNVESLRDDDTPWSTPCICHAIFIEGGIAVAAATAAFHGIDPRTSFLICEGLLFSWWMCGIYTGLVRQSLQKKYHLKSNRLLCQIVPHITCYFLNMQNSPCDPCMVHCCLHWCALCQEHREMKSRLSDNVAMQMTIVNPPPVQEMNAAVDNRESGPSSANGVNQTNLEMQAL
ncbi:hypothetical protein MTR67_013507 [Solanum verrucosum]|uniref:Cell number regulator 6 n=1 Tax=Solanum verrucosum TaxID=315347 RepID=A0AAF0TGY8_SOLVR|nr:hypothetical protein MTR67_013507 [Solanum verrucosum]